LDDDPVFAALADPLRRSLLANLAANSPRTATQLARDYPISRQGVLKHLRLLEAAGLVAVQAVGREKRYALNPAPLAEVERYIAALAATWDARLLRLKALVEGDEAAGAPGGLGGPKKEGGAVGSPLEGPDRSGA
jgi:DNA-binding transcriptional ArsR family regulator